MAFEDHDSASRFSMRLPAGKNFAGICGPS
jgi:hypothetical protein